MPGQRLARVHRRLSDPRHAGSTVAAIAYASGFRDISTFNRAFRQQFGMTPSDARAPALAHRRPRFDKADGVTHGGETGRDAVRDLDGEPLLARHDDLDHVETVGAEVFGQARIVGETPFVGAEMEDEDIPDFCGYIVHRTLPST